MTGRGEREGGGESKKGDPFYDSAFLVQCINLLFNTTLTKQICAYHACLPCERKREKKE